MKHLRNMFAFIISLIMMINTGATAFAATQTVAYTKADGDGAVITINNPAKGETYKIYKLFDATVSDDGKISYQGTVPTALSNYFTADKVGYIYPNEAIKDSQGNTKMTDALKSDLESWATTEDALIDATSDGNETLEFSNLPYGYYVITTTHKSDATEGEEAKSAITVTSTQPNASVFDKNVNTPTADKTVGKTSYSIGDTIKYTATFDTTNYMGEGESARQVVEYVIEDTLPSYLDNVTVKSITIGGAEQTVQQFNNKKITIVWATQGEDNKYTSNYAQGAQIVIVYEAKLTSTTNINAADKNVIKITPVTVKDDGTDKKPWEKSWEDDAVITTYAAALKKTDGTSALKGAEFSVKGLVVEETEAGVYTVVSYDPAANVTADLKTDENGKLYIVGLASDATLTVTETKAPDGYNKLPESKELTPKVLTQQVYKTSGYEKYDKDGNLVERKTEETTGYTQVTKNLSELLDNDALEIVNNQGTVLPSTGGIGTTIFYIVGGIMVAGAVVFLLTKRRIASNE
jgi:LPXTG-motif cell wall-anchored protein